MPLFRKSRGSPAIKALSAVASGIYAVQHEALSAILAAAREVSTLETDDARRAATISGAGITFAVGKLDEIATTAGLDEDLRGSAGAAAKDAAMRRAPSELSEETVKQIIAEGQGPLGSLTVMDVAVAHIERDTAAGSICRDVADSAWNAYTAILREARDAAG